MPDLQARCPLNSPPLRAKSGLIPQKQLKSAEPAKKNAFAVFVGGQKFVSTKKEGPFDVSSCISPILRFFPSSLPHLQPLVHPKNGFFFSIHKQTEWLQKKSAVAIRTKIQQPSKKSALKGSRFGFVRGRFLCMIGRKGYFATRPILSVSEDFRYCSLADSWEPPLQGHSARKCAERATRSG